MSDMALANHLFWKLVKAQGIPSGLSINIGYGAVSKLEDEYDKRLFLEGKKRPSHLWRVIGLEKQAGFWIMYKGDNQIDLPPAFQVWEHRTDISTGISVIWGYLDDRTLEAERKRMEVPA
ncbi:MAG: hypothetical protein MPK62_01015 [Alphaproteobacteria bacterium]|nr:hypothetical protein [Alphaproteobacteria bacterium]MDA8029715.1 hypothetical protein [Alphaproteobacteria bacterium]